MSMRSPYSVSRDDVRGDADDGAVDGRVDVGSRRGADVERRRRAAVELVPDGMSAAAAEDRMEHALDEPLVALTADRRERERAVARRVVADRGEMRLRDRHLQPDRAVHGDDLRIRPRLRRRCGVHDRELPQRLRVPPPNAVSSNAITSTIARSARSANRRARRAARTSRRSTRRLRVGREDGMSIANLSNGPCLVQP